VWVLITFFTGVVPGLVAYLVAWLVMPEAPVVVAEPVNVTAPPESNFTQPASN